jgi:hypothetical protein
MKCVCDIKTRFNVNVVKNRVTRSEVGTYCAGCEQNKPLFLHTILACPVAPSLHGCASFSES